MPHLRAAPLYQGRATSRPGNMLQNEVRLPMLHAMQTVEAISVQPASADLATLGRPGSSATGCRACASLRRTGLDVLGCGRASSSGRPR